MSIFPSTVEGLSKLLGVLNSLYLTALVVGVVSTAGIVHFGNVLQKVKDDQLTQQRLAADVKIAEAGTQAQTAIASAEAARTEQQRLTQENLQLSLKLEEERQARLEIERKLAPRFLTASERRSIVEVIKAYKGHPIQITRLGDAEASAYGNSVIETIREAGWSIQVNSVGILGPPAYGVICRTSTHPDSAVQALIAILSKVDLSTKTRTVSTPDEGFVQIIVGLKPLNY